MGAQRWAEERQPQLGTPLLSPKQRMRNSSALTRKLSLTVLFGAGGGWVLYIFLHFWGDQTAAQFFRSLSRFPGSTGVSTNKILPESILTGGCSCPVPNRAGLETLYLPRRQAEARPPAAPPQRHPQGARRPGVSAKETPPKPGRARRRPRAPRSRSAAGTAAPQPRRRLWRPVRQPDRAFLSSASFPRGSPVV